MWKPKKSKYELEAEHILEALNNAEPGSETYAKLVDDLKRFSEAKEKLSPALNANTVATLVASGLEILLMLNYERLNTVTSKAFSLLIRPKL